MDKLCCILILETGTCSGVVLLFLVQITTVLKSEKCTVHSIHSHRGAKCSYVSKNSQKSSSCCSLGAAIDLEGPVKAGRDQELGVPSESHSCGESSVLTQNLKRDWFETFVYLEEKLKTTILLSSHIISVPWVRSTACKGRRAHRIQRPPSKYHCCRSRGPSPMTRRMCNDFVQGRKNIWCITLRYRFTS